MPARELLQRRRSSITSPRGPIDVQSAQPGEESADVEAGRQGRGAGLHTRRSTLGVHPGGWTQGEPQLSDATGLVRQLCASYPSKSANGVHSLQVSGTYCDLWDFQ